MCLYFQKIYTFIVQSINKSYFLFINSSYFSLLYKWIKLNDIDTARQNCQKFWFICAVKVDELLRKCGMKSFLINCLQYFTLVVSVTTHNTIITILQLFLFQLLDLLIFLINYLTFPYYISTMNKSVIFFLF